MRERRPNALLLAGMAWASCSPDVHDAPPGAEAPGTARVTAALVHDDATPQASEMALLSYVRRADGHASVDGLIVTLGRPATAELEPGTYALLAQSLLEAKCALEIVHVAGGADRELELRLGPGRRLTLEFGEATRTASQHYLVLQDGEPIFVHFVGALAAELALPDRDLELELHGVGCEPVSRAALPRSVALVSVP